MRLSITKTILTIAGASAGMLGIAQLVQYGRGKESRPAPVLLPTGQTARPAGRAATFKGRPVDLAVSPDGKRVYAKDDRGLVVIDAESWTVLQELNFPRGGASMHGIVVSSDGARIFATNSDNLLCEARVSEEGKLSWQRQINLPGPEGRGASYPCGIAPASDGKTAYVALSRNNTLGVVDLDTGKLTHEVAVGVAPYDVALSADGKTCYVSNWGGRRAVEGDETATSAGTPTVVDSRGIAASGSVSAVDLKALKEIGQVETGLHPSDLLLNARGDTLFCANANSDTITEISTQPFRTRRTISVHLDLRLPFGSAPNALALSPDEGTLYCANAGNNAIAVISLNEGNQGYSMRGMIPTGWYPGSIALAGTSLYVACVKGMGSRGGPIEISVPAKAADGKKSPAPPTRQVGEAKGHNVYDYLGVISRVDIPDAARLRSYTAEVRSDAHIAGILRDREAASESAEPVPVPRRVGDPSVFEHVVYIIKENRTYDQLFGDIKEGNGDPNLVMFGEDVTPNHHALAREFVLLDNFYCNGVLSADGHSWVTEGNVTDHLEKSFGGFTRSYTFGDDPLTYSSSGFIWDNALAHGKTVRNYGEMDYASPNPAGNFFAIYKDHVEKTGRFGFKQNIGVANLRRFSEPGYPGWNLAIPDVLRADRFLKELKRADEKGEWPNLNIVYLPQDHTSGTGTDSPTPRAMVADNDLALGRVVEGISRSRFWGKTCIFVVEDDPQAGVDHVDGHRSPCLVISPYTKRHAVIHKFYNQTSVIHTMERILQLPAMNQMDALAPLMLDCYTDKPDNRPYTSVPNRVPLDERNPPVKTLRGNSRRWAMASRKLRFDAPDRIDDRTFNRVIWSSVYPTRPYPEDWEGAHGRGLAALGLKLSGKVEKDLDD